MNDYYKKQLEKLNIKSDYPLTIVINDETYKTKHLNLNIESIESLREFLDKLELKLLKDN